MVRFRPGFPKDLFFGLASAKKWEELLGRMCAPLRCYTEPRECRTFDGCKMSYSAGG